MLNGSFYRIISESETPEGDSVFVVRVNPDHEIYKAHFPGYPITPGVCIVKIATELLGQKIPRAVLSSADNVKFLTPLIPDPEEDLEFSFRKKGEDVFMVSVNGRQLYSKMKIGISRSKVLDQN